MFRDPMRLVLAVFTIFFWVTVALALLAVADLLRPGSRGESVSRRNRVDEPARRRGFVGVALKSRRRIASYRSTSSDRPSNYPD